jgi:hypothetical protein
LCSWTGRECKRPVGPATVAYLGRGSSGRSAATRIFAPFTSHSVFAEYARRPCAFESVYNLQAGGQGGSRPRWRGSAGKHGYVSETGALGRTSGLSCCCSQNLFLLPHNTPHEVLLSTAESEKIQALLCRSTCRFQTTRPTATLSSRHCHQSWLQRTRIRGITAALPSSHDGSD